MIDLNEIPIKPQRQDSINDQLLDLIAVGNRLGMYDAADVIRQFLPRLNEVRYGCHCDLEPHMEPDGCVIDTEEYDKCIYAKKAGRKERCEYWRIIVKEAK
jgi:hypothetical protein